jgi:antitoxin VapB
MKTTKTFKSGNSVAIRLPKALGIEAGTEMRVREEQGKYILEPVRKTIDISGFAGKAPWLKPLTPEEREFDDSPRDWHLLRGKKP